MMDLENMLDVVCVRPGESLVLRFTDRMIDDDELAVLNDFAKRRDLNLLVLDNTVQIAKLEA